MALTKMIAKTSLSLANKDKIYISGSITNDKDYRLKFKAAHFYLLNRYNCIVINPLHLSTKVENAIPFPQWHHYMRECIHWLSRCDKVYMLKGWWKSKGARIEWVLAKFLRLDIIYQRGK